MDGRGCGATLVEVARDEDGRGEWVDDAIDDADDDACEGVGVDDVGDSGRDDTPVPEPVVVDEQPASSRADTIHTARLTADSLAYHRSPLGWANNAMRSE